LGGGNIATEKLPPLLEVGAQITVIASAASAEIKARAERGEISRLSRDYQPGDLAGSRLVIDATDQPEINRLVREEANRERALLNVVDRTHLCDWIAPAVVNRGPLKIAISTAGESPFLAGRLRRWLERLVGEEWGEFTQLIGELRRRLRRQGMGIERQTSIYQRALRSDIRQLLRRGEHESAIRRLGELETLPGAGQVTIAGAGPGSREHLTEAVHEALLEADIIFHDALIEPEVLALCRSGAQLIDVGKRCSGPKVDHAEINRQLIEAAESGAEVLRLKGGDPFIFGLGGEEVAALTEAGFKVRILPGLSSATAGPTLAGIPLTLRGVAASVTFCTAHLAHGPAQLLQMAIAADTLVILMAFERAAEICRQLTQVLGEEQPVALITNASTVREHCLTSTLGQLPNQLNACQLEPPGLL
ncbi:MAG: uroporphyrinogen-III C-methyltransferase, partial [Candidatus Dormibacteraceae bacterium]